MSSKLHISKKNLGRVTDTKKNFSLGKRSCKSLSTQDSNSAITYCFEKAEKKLKTVNTEKTTISSHNCRLNNNKETKLIKCESTNIKTNSKAKNPTTADSGDIMANFILQPPNYYFENTWVLKDINKKLNERLAKQFDIFEESFDKLRNAVKKWMLLERIFVSIFLFYNYFSYFPFIYPIFTFERYFC